LDRRWKSICPQLRVERVPGSHYGMLQKPNVDELARRLDHHLAEELITD
jgi:thioesterase domain-containing protein